MDREATLAIANARPVLIGNKSDLEKVILALVPAKGFRWSKALLSAVKGTVINDFMCCVWVADYPKE